MTYLRLALALYALSFVGCTDIDLDPIDLTYSVTGTVRDATSNAPLEGVKVTIAGRSAMTAANGTYTVANLPKATLPLSVEKSGYTTMNDFVVVDVLITQKNLSLQRL